MDDILIAIPSLDEYIKHVQIVFERFEKFGVVINPVKCEFDNSEINFLGYNVNSAAMQGHSF